MAREALARIMRIFELDPELCHRSSGRAPHLEQTLGDGSSIYDVLEAWDEPSAIWALRATGLVWAGIGAPPPSRGTVVRGTIPAPQAQYTETVVALDAASVGAWVAQPESNFGFAIVTTGSKGTGFRSREDPTAGRRPYLTITYRP